MDVNEVITKVSPNWQIIDKDGSAVYVCNKGVSVLIDAYSVQIEAITPDTTNELEIFADDISTMSFEDNSLVLVTWSGMKIEISTTPMEYVYD